MKEKLLASIIRISEVLRKSYGLTLEQAVECINSYVDITFLSEKKENIDFFLGTNLNAWAEEMYYNYTRSVQPGKEELSKAEGLVGTCIPCDETYMDWLRDFTKDTLGFSDCNWDECPETLSQSDLENVAKLRCLFCEIANYIYGEKINPEVIERCCSLFHVKYKDLIFEVGSENGHYYVEVVGKNIKPVIQFEAVMAEMRKAASEPIEFKNPNSIIESDGANGALVYRRTQRNGCCRYNVFSR